MYERSLTCPDGLAELERRLDNEPHEPHGPTRQGEVHIHRIFWNPTVERPDYQYPAVPAGLGFNGLLTRGRGNTPHGPALPVDDAENPLMVSTDRSKQSIME